MSNEAAAQIWQDMTVAQRLAVMQQVPYQRSEIKRYRACIAFVAKRAK